MIFESGSVFPISALQKNQREVREAAKSKLLRITENGAPAFVFCSEEVLERTIDRAVEEALYERECLEALERGEKDIQAGKFVTGVDELERAVSKKRTQAA